MRDQNSGFDPNRELERLAKFDRHGDNEVPPGADYTHEEVRTNLFWNALVTLAALLGIWFAWGLDHLPTGGAIALTVIVLILSRLYRWLFASHHAAKLDEDSAGSGKRVGPVTMGTILGYLNDGFKW